MTSRDHERFRRQLEKQLRADVELIYAGYCAKLRAYEAMHRLSGELDPMLLLPADLPLRLAPAPLPAALVPAPAAAAPPAAAPPKRSGANELYNALCAALGQLPEVFDSGDVLAALDFAPRRASLYRVLGEMVRDGWLALVERGEGHRRNRYRKLHAAGPPASDGED